MKFSFAILLTFTLVMPSFISNNVFATSSRVSKIVSEDVTERLEDIQALKHSIRDLKLQIQVLNVVLIEAKKHPSNKKLYVNGRKVADAITAITILGGALATYKLHNKASALKIASFIGGLSTAISVLLGLAADLSTDETETVEDKIVEVNKLLAATTVNLNKEIKLLCASEPSNQMCR